MKKVVIITNMMSFYRVKLFNELTKSKDFSFHVIFSTQVEKNDRKWPIDKGDIRFSYTILDSKQIIKKQSGIQEKKITYIPKGIVKELKSIKPEIIIGSEYNPTSLIAFFYAKLKRLKYISWSDGTLHSERFISLSQKISRKIICRFSNGLIASSTKTKEAQLHYGAKESKIFISLLTIDVKGFVNKIEMEKVVKNKAPVLLYCSYLLKRKGLSLLLDALRFVKTDFYLKIVGSGEEEQNLRNLVREYKLDSKVEFLGYIERDEIVKYYRGADVFVFPTLLEPFGLVLVEALASSLPIISSKYAGALDDVMPLRENGFVVDPNDNNKFAESITELLNDKNKREAMGKISKELSKKFYLNKVKTGFFDVLSYVKTEHN